MRRALITIGAVGFAALSLAACDEKGGEETALAAQEVRPGCEALPRGLKGKEVGKLDPEVWQQVSDTGSAWVLVVLADESALQDGAEPDLEAVQAVQQRLLHDLDVNDNEKVFGGRNIAVISLEIDPGRARLLETLPYVCHVSFDKKLWPME